MGISNYNKMFQAVWSELRRLRVENRKLMCFRGFCSNVAVAGWESQANMLQTICSKVWRMRVRNLKLQFYVSGGLVRSVAVAGWKSQTNMSKVWMRVDYLKNYYIAGGFVQNVVDADWEVQSTVICFRRIGPKCGGCGLRIAN